MDTIWNGSNPSSRQCCILAEDLDEIIVCKIKLGCQCFLRLL